MPFSKSFVVASLPALIALPLLGQTPAAIERGEALQRERESKQLLRDLQNNKVEEAPAISPDEAQDVGPQSILQRHPLHTWFEVNLDSQIYWTDNMFFNESNGGSTVSSSVIANSAQFNLVPPTWKWSQTQFQPRVGYQHIWMNYAWLGPRHEPDTGLFKSRNDFDSQGVFGDVSANWGGWQAQAGFEWQRLLSHQPTYGTYNEFYRDYTPRWSLTRVFNIGNRQAVIAGYLGSHHFTHVDATPGLQDQDRNDRTDHSLLLNYNYQIAPKLIASPGYRFQFTHYAHGHRLDQLHSFSASLIYMVNDWFVVRGFAGYDLRESDDPIVPDYRKLDSGIAIGASFKF